MATPSSSPIAPAVAVVTVSYGSEDVLDGFLRSIPTASAHPLLVAVVDNKSDDGSAVSRLADDAGARYLPLASNCGYGAAMNAGASTLSPAVEWILLSNPDVLLAPGCVDELVRVGNEDSAIGSVGPVIYNTDGTIYPSARSVPSLRTGIGHAMFANLWIGNPWTKAYRRDSELSLKRRDAGWLSGACLLVRRSAFEQLGGFCPAYFMYFEDVDLGYRLGKLGYRNVYAPSASVTHFGAHSTTGESRKMIDAHHDSAQLFLSRKYSGPWLWPVRLVLKIGLKLRSSLVHRNLDH